MSKCKKMGLYKCRNVEMYKCRMWKCRNVELRTVSTQTELSQWQDDFNWSSQDMVKKKVPPMVKKYGGAGRVGQRSSWGLSGLVGKSLDKCKFVCIYIYIYNVR